MFNYQLLNPPATAGRLDHVCSLRFSNLQFSRLQSSNLQISRPSLLACWRFAGCSWRLCWLQLTICWLQLTILLAVAAADIYRLHIFRISRLQISSNIWFHRALGTPSGIPLRFVVGGRYSKKRHRKLIEFQHRFYIDFGRQSDVQNHQ